MTIPTPTGLRQGSNRPTDNAPNPGATGRFGDRKVTPTPPERRTGMSRIRTGLASMKHFFARIPGRMAAAVAREPRADRRLREAQEEYGTRLGSLLKLLSNKETLAVNVGSELVDLMRVCDSPRSLLKSDDKILPQQLASRLNDLPDETLAAIAIGARAAENKTGAPQYEDKLQIIRDAAISKLTKASDIDAALKNAAKSPNDGAKAWEVAQNAIKQGKNLGVFDEETPAGLIKAALTRTKNNDPTAFLKGLSTEQLEQLLDARAPKGTIAPAVDQALRQEVERRFPGLNDALDLALAEPGQPKATFTERPWVTLRGRLEQVFSNERKTQAFVRALSHQQLANLPKTLGELGLESNSPVLTKATNAVQTEGGDRCRAAQSGVMKAVNEYIVKLELCKGTPDAMLDAVTFSNPTAKAPSLALAVGTALQTYEALGHLANSNLKDPASRIDEVQGFVTTALGDGKGYAAKGKLNELFKKSKTHGLADTGGQLLRLRGTKPEAAAHYPPELVGALGALSMLSNASYVDTPRVNAPVGQLLGPDGLVAIHSKFGPFHGSLADALRLDSGFRTSFLAYCESEHSTENLEFWNAVESFVQAPTLKAAKAIRDNYLVPGAQKEVNLAGTLTGPVIKLLEDVAEANVHTLVSSLQTAQEGIEITMKDTLDRFLLKDDGRKFAYMIR